MSNEIDTQLILRSPMYIKRMILLKRFRSEKISDSLKQHSYVIIIIKIFIYVASLLIQFYTVFNNILFIVSLLRVQRENRTIIARLSIRIERYFSNPQEDSMSNKEVDYRQSPLRDDKLIIHTSVVKEHYITHNAAFYEFNDTIFHTTYSDDIQSKITLAQKTMSDAFILKRQARQTSIVEEHKNSLVRELNTVEFNVKRTFPNDPSIVNEFRLNKISEIAKNIDSLIGFSKDVHVMVQNYQEELTSEGYSNQKAVVLKNKIEELDKHRRVQVEAMHTRPLHTKDRITKMNILWQQLCELKEASDLIFADEEEIRSLFALPKASVKNHDEEDERSELVEDDTIINIDDLDENEPNQ